MVELLAMAPNWKGSMKGSTSSQSHLTTGVSSSFDKIHVKEIGQMSVSTALGGLFLGMGQIVADFNNPGNFPSLMLELTIAQKDGARMPEKSCNTQFG